MENKLRYIEITALFSGWYLVTFFRDQTYRQYKRQELSWLSTDVIQNDTYMQPASLQILHNGLTVSFNVNTL